jgi:hypothetical protein
LGKIFAHIPDIRRKVTKLLRGILETISKVVSGSGASFHEVHSFTRRNNSQEQSRLSCVFIETTYGGPDICSSTSKVTKHSKDFEPLLWMFFFDSFIAVLKH